MFKRVVGFEKYMAYEDGRIVGAFGRVLRPCEGHGGYGRVCLSKGHTRKWMYIHRLVCTAFVENPLSKPEINHKDGNKFNNHYENLERVTRSENNIHAFRTGLKHGIKGESHIGHKVTGREVQEIRKMRGVYTQRRLGELYGLAHSQIGKIQRGENWKEVANV